MFRFHSFEDTFFYYLHLGHEKYNNTLLLAGVQQELTRPPLKRYVLFHLMGPVSRNQISVLQLFAVWAICLLEAMPKVITLDWTHTSLTTIGHSWAKLTQNKLWLPAAGVECHCRLHGNQYHSMHHPPLWDVMISFPCLPRTSVHRDISVFYCLQYLWRHSYCLSRASFNNCTTYASLFSSPHNWTPSISSFTLTLFLTPLVSRTQSGTGREKGVGERQRTWKKTTKFGSLES